MAPASLAKSGGSKCKGVLVRSQRSEARAPCARGGAAPLRDNEKNFDVVFLVDAENPSIDCRNADANPGRCLHAQPFG